MAEVTQKLKVKLKGGGPWGFRLLGGAGTGLPLTVAKIRRKSKSYKNLQEGDLFIRVNGVPCDNLTYDQVMCIADKRGEELDLEIERKAPKLENATVETIPKTSIFSTEVANDIIQQKKTVMTNIAEKTKETTSTVTDTKPTVTNIIKETNFSITNELSSNEIQDSIQKQSSVSTESNKKSETVTDEGVNSEKGKSATPEVTSDVSTKTTAEVTPTSEKYEKVQTEKIHEKLDNKETTIIRTDHEEVIKSHDIATKPLVPPNSLLSELTKEPENVIESLTRESFEITKSEKKEVTTKTINGFVSGLEDDASKKHETISSAPEMKDTFASTIDSSVLDSMTTTFEKTGMLSSWQSQFDSSVVKKKKMFSSSSFYEEPHAIYPTMEEQVEMAKKIAESLADDTNKKSKGANMFFKRAKRSTKWIHEGPEPTSDSGPGTPDTTPEPFYPEYYVDSSQSRKNGPKLKLVLDPRHPIDAASLRSTGHNISEHNVISPAVCHGLVKDLESPVGKGGALFAKRKKKSSEWVVDEDKVKSLMKSHENTIEQLKPNLENAAKENATPFRPPYDTFEPPFKRQDSLYNRINPERLAETVIQAAECKRRDSIQSNEEQLYESCRSPIIPATPAACYYDIYKAKAPKGWSSPSVTPSPLTNFNPTGISETYEEPSFYPTATMPRKYQFQNFNTLPRKWKSPY